MAAVTTGTIVKVAGKLVTVKNKKGERPVLKIVLSVIGIVFIILSAVLTLPGEILVGVVNGSETENVPYMDVTESITSSQTISLEDASVTVYDTGLKIPHYLQYDSKWAAIAYGTGTIRSSGCGPTCAAMLSSYFEGKYINPIQAARYAQENGYRVSEGTSWGFFSDYMGCYHIRCTDLGLNMDSVLTELKSGNPVIASMGPGTFTKGGHFIVLRGVDALGNIYVNDPNDSSDKRHYEKAFSPSLIYAEAKNFWAFTK